MPIRFRDDIVSGSTRVREAQLPRDVLHGPRSPLLVGVSFRPVAEPSLRIRITRISSKAGFLKDPLKDSPRGGSLREAAQTIIVDLVPEGEV